jgi:hypothetical protein
MSSIGTPPDRGDWQAKLVLALRRFTRGADPDILFADFTREASAEIRNAFRARRWSSNAVSFATWLPLHIVQRTFRGEIRSLYWLVWLPALCGYRWKLKLEPIPGFSAFDLKESMLQSKFETSNGKPCVPNEDVDKHNAAVARIVAERKWRGPRSKAHLRRRDQGSSTTSASTTSEALPAESD